VYFADRSDELGGHHGLSDYVHDMPVDEDETKPLLHPGDVIQYTQQVPNCTGFVSLVPSAVVAYDDDASDSAHMILAQLQPL